jgi:tRNA G18 (ribose-2'-O)-methylase SpoU
MTNDIRLPHASEKANRQIRRSALGAEAKDNIYHRQDAFEVIKELRASGFKIIALEQTHDSVNINDFKPPHKLAIIIGREVEGVEPEILKAVDQAIEIPMDGIKESFNVSVAAAIALYKFRYP